MDYLSSKASLDGFYNDLSNESMDVTLASQGIRQRYRECMLRYFNKSFFEVTAASLATANLECG